jgi:non-ribosomal peptide synthetase-like protein
MTPAAVDQRRAVVRRRAGSPTCPPALGAERAPAPAAPHARTLLDIFNATAVRCGERVAIDAADSTMSYLELAGAAEALGERLRTRGIGPGDRVGIQVQSGTARLYTAILGVLFSGAAYVPIDFDDPRARADELLERSGACALIGDALTITELAPAVGAAGEPGIDDDAWIIFTSGSTGVPKGVAVSHGSAAAFVDAEAELWSVSAEDRVLAGLSVSFDASVEEIWLAWRNGATLVPAPRALVRAGAELGPWLAEHRVSVVSTVPTLAAMWDEECLAGVRLLILGGEACPEALARRLSAGCEVWNTYGPTEATVVSTATRLRPKEPVTIGWPLRGWEIAIVDDGGEPVSIGDPGELVIAGVGLARYLDSELDAQRFAALPALGWDRAYRTGDIVRETIEGLQFVGRRDDQVKVGGRRIELGELDAQLSEAPGVRAALSAIGESSAGNKLLVGYVVGEVDPAHVRTWLAERLPEGLVPLIVTLDSLPRGRSGKVDRRALPWPPPTSEGPAPGLEPGGTAAWVAERFTEQLGPATLTRESDFFALGGSSLAAAKLASALRERFPAVAVSDIYNHRTLGELSDRLDRIGAREHAASAAQTPASRRFGLAQLGGVLALMASAAPQWLLGILTLDRLYPGGIGPQVGWGWLAAGWLLFASVPGRALLLASTRRMLLSRVQPGRYSRHGWLMWRIWFLERLAQVAHLDLLAGTPWAARYARLAGHRVGDGARLGTIPAPTSLVRIGERATLEPEVDLHGWWIDGQELVVGAPQIGPGARIGTRALLMPGASVGEGAEVEPGSVIAGEVPPGERWAGSPASRVGGAGDGWPAQSAPRAGRRRAWKAMYGVGLSAESALALIASLPGIALLLALGPARWSAGSVLATVGALAPLMAASFVIVYAVLVALLFRAVSALIRPGWHRDEGATAWALWFTGTLMAGARGVLFPLYSSVYTRPWLRLAGIHVGRRTEVSTAVGLGRLARLGETSVVADDVAFADARARDGWLHVAPIELGDRSFLGNSAILQAGTAVGDDSLVGVLTTAPRQSLDGSSWLGAPALELPRAPERHDPARTTDPPRRLVLARGVVELVRILLPATIAAILGALVFVALDATAEVGGLWLMVAAAPFAVLAAGTLAVLVTAAVKWTLIGRYRAGEHPLWSSFVWRDEIVNSAQEQLAGPWLLDAVLATPLMSAYLRLMGARVGRDVWCETMTITEFELARLGRGCTINRNSVVETHLFHDRLMRLGPIQLEEGSTLGPSSALLPDTSVGERCAVGGRSIVMRGERLPAHTRWQGAPVVAL